MTSCESGELDDWFDEPETADVWTARVGRLTRERQERVDDDWLHDEKLPDAPRSRPRFRVHMLVAALLVVLLLGILAAAGVFSGSSVEVSTTASTPTAPATTATVTKPRQQAPAVPTTTLKPGDQGSAVSELQRALEYIGYSPGAVDGVYGAATTQAVTRFQQAHGLTADGIAGDQTLAALRQAVSARS
jgi:Putative peptidoglycan binding domain